MNSVDLGFHHMLVKDVELGHWCSKYELERYQCECMECGREMDVCLPFVAEKRRGLRAEPCCCGNHFVPFSFVDLSQSGTNMNSLGKSI